MQNHRSIPSPTVTDEQHQLILRFNAAFAQIDSHLRKLAGKDRFPTFMAVLKEVSYSKKVNLDFEFLEKVNELRNVLIHENKGVKVYLSVPVEKVVEHLEQIRDDLLNPVKVIPKFQRKVTEFQTNDTLQEVLQVIAEKNYSQFPIHNNGEFKGLLTENGITRGLAHYSKEVDSIIEFKETPIQTLLREEEQRKNYRFIRGDLSVMDAEMLFVNNPELEALLITNSGKQQEKLLGIITRWDILHLKGD